MAVVSAHVPASHPVRRRPRPVASPRPLYDVALAELIRWALAYAELTDQEGPHSWPDRAGASVLEAGSRMRIAAKQLLKQKRASR